MGLCGWLAAKMLRVPLVGTYHTDFPAYIDSLTGDHRIVNGVPAGRFLDDLAELLQHPGRQPL